MRPGSSTFPLGKANELGESRRVSWGGKSLLRYQSRSFVLPGLTQLIPSNSANFQPGTTRPFNMGIEGLSKAIGQSPVSRGSLARMFDCFSVATGGGQRVNVIRRLSQQALQ